MNLTSFIPTRDAGRLPAVAAGLATLLLAAACSPGGDANPAGTARIPTATAASAATSAAGAATAASAATSAAGAATRGSVPLGCTAPANPTTAQTEGPYFRAGAPLVTTLITSGVTGTRLTLTGNVLTTSCQPLANAKVDIWQADATGAYDNSGYRLRGYTLTDANGRWTIETIIPGQYPGRTEHIHVKVTPLGGATLTSQLYFPAERASNTSDGIYSPDLQLTMTPSGNGYIGAFTFVIKT